MSRIAPEYVAARRVLLDALIALQGHTDNLILVGAQAVYHHTGDADLNVPIMTSDADLAIDVTDLAEVPEIGSLLRNAGFAPGDNPGHWVSLSQVAIELNPLSWTRNLVSDCCDHLAVVTIASRCCLSGTSHFRLPGQVKVSTAPAAIPGNSY